MMGTFKFMKRLTDDEKNWFIEPQEQYTQFFEDCNWYTFDFCIISFENDGLMGGYDFTFILLGLGFRWRWNHTVTETMQACTDAVEDIESGKATLEPFPLKKGQDDD